MPYKFVVMYFLFIICLCVFAVVVTIVVLHMYLRADSKPMAAMPAWVSTDCTIWPTSVCAVILSVFGTNISIIYENNYDQ